MTATCKILIVTGTINAFLTIGIGAFGAHALKNRITPDMLVLFNTAAHYHGYHALGLILVGVSGYWLTSTRLLKWAGSLMFTGIMLFSGSLYLLSITGVRTLGMITPFGGIAFLLAWLLFTIAVLKQTVKKA